MIQYFCFYPSYRYVKENNLKNEWDTCTRGLWCPWNGRAPQRATTLVDRLRDGWQHLLRDRATRTLTFNDEQFHVLERIKVNTFNFCLIMHFCKQSKEIIFILLLLLAGY